MCFVDRLGREDAREHGAQEARFGAMRVETEGAEQRVAVEVDLGSLDAEAVRVELYADAIDDRGPERHAMELIRKLDTPRLLPRHPVASVPLEAHEILWQR